MKIENIVCDKILESHSRIIGITGIDCSGKTSFSCKIMKTLQFNNKKSIVIHIDDFLQDRKTRYQLNSEVQNYFNHTFNYSLLIEAILQPIKRTGTVNAILTLLNENTDKLDLIKEYNIDKDTIVILEGVFLFRPELMQYLDFKIFLGITFDECCKRALVRDENRWNEDVISRYNRKYIPTQKKYLSEINVQDIADIYIDNNDYNTPCIIGTVPMYK